MHVKDYFLHRIDYVEIICNVLRIVEGCALYLK